MLPAITWRCSTDPSCDHPGYMSHDTGGGALLLFGLCGVLQLWWSWRHDHIEFSDYQICYLEIREKHIIIILTNHEHNPLHGEQQDHEMW